MKEKISKRYEKQLNREASKFLDKFLRDEKKKKILMRHISPSDFTDLLKIALEKWEFNWKDEGDEI